MRSGPQHGGMHAADIDRRIENLLQLGTIASVDLQAKRCTVKVGDLVTAPIPWLEQRAGATRTWSPPSDGEQVLLLSPGGDPKRGVVLRGVYSTANPAPADREKLDHATYADGAVIEYDAVAHKLTATLPDGATADITASGGIHATGDVTITGKLRVTDTVQLDSDVHCDATVTSDTDVVGGNVSLKNHPTTGVTAGSDLSGPPQPQ